MKLCECGCGQPAPLASTTNNRIGYKKGDPFRFVLGHFRPPLKHGFTRNKGRTPTYNSWASMIQRCSNPNGRWWPRYGGRGIKVCDHWRAGFAAFFADMGERPKGTTLDRYPNPDGNYEPGNCRWATDVQQRQTQRQNGGMRKKKV